MDLLQMALAVREEARTNGTHIASSLIKREEGGDAMRFERHHAG